jgi:hypothetical protein
MYYLFLIMFVLLTLVMIVRIRVRFHFGSGQRLLFVGLGRTGPEFDLAARVGCLKLCGLNIKRFPLDRAKAKPPKKMKPPKEKTLSRKKTRRPTLSQLKTVVPAVAKAAWAYFRGLLKAVIVEELQGEITGGFASPDVTGTVFGYYQAALAAVPAVAGRVTYIPDWTGPSFSGVVRGSVALPIYKLVFLTIRLVFELPLKQLLKLAIGRKKGGQDGQ